MASVLLFESMEGRPRAFTSRPPAICQRKIVVIAGRMGYTRKGLCQLDTFGGNLRHLPPGSASSTVEPDDPEFGTLVWCRTTDVWQRLHSRGAVVRCSGSGYATRDLSLRRPETARGTCEKIQGRLPIPGRPADQGFTRLEPPQVLSIRDGSALHYSRIGTRRGRYLFESPRHPSSSPCVRNARTPYAATRPPGRR